MKTTHAILLSAIWAGAVFGAEELPEDVAPGQTGENKKEAPPELIDPGSEKPKKIIGHKAHYDESGRLLA
ncbi:MAG TPA: hypothetical protein VEA63_15550, partial [Opitutus sp.]|nr:hypothetical protein [Opitutus sp.]